MVSLKDGHRPTADYVRKLRHVLPSAFPEDILYFQAADMVTQILNFGVTAQINCNGREAWDGQRYLHRVGRDNIRLGAALCNKRFRLRRPRGAALFVVSPKPVTYL